MVWLAYVRPASLGKILTGHKTAESRFGLRLPLAANCAGGDVIYFKAGHQTARAVVTERIVYRLANESLEHRFERLSLRWRVPAEIARVCPQLARINIAQFTNSILPHIF